MSEDDGKSLLTEGKLKKDITIAIASDDEWEDNLEAARCCPVNIIKVERV
jgi:ferredoxin